MSVPGTREHQSFSGRWPPAYAERAGSYERDTNAFQPYRQAIVEALPLRPGQVVLDVGCGTGLCAGLLREAVGESGAVVGIEEAPAMAAAAREHIADAGWRNVTVLECPAEQAEVGVTADAALFCAVHDILRSPEALRNVLGCLRPGAFIAAGGGKWAAPFMVALNMAVRSLHAPYVRSFEGFGRPWTHLAELTDDVEIHEIAYGAGFVMTARARPLN